MTVDLLRFEVWSRPDTGSFTRKFALKSITDYELNDPIGIGQGKLILPSNHPKLDQIHKVDVTNHANDVASMIRVFIGSTPVFDFYAARRETAYTDVGDETVEISGPTPISALDRTRVWFYDAPASPSVQRDWIYGDDSGAILKNGGFEDNSASESKALVNGDAETGDTTGWAPTDTLGAAYRDVTDWGVSSAQFRSGSYSFWFDPTTRHSGIWQKFTVTPGERVHIVGYLKEPTAAGKRYTMAASVGTGWVDNNPALNQFVYSGNLMAELGNVASTGTGLPGGSTDGTWQKFELDFNAGTDQTEVTLVFQYDHHDGSNGPIAYVDDVTVDGFGLGLEPWEIWGTASGFELDTVTFDEGVQSAKWTPSQGVADGDAMFQQIAVENGKTYTLSARVYHTDGVNRTLRLVLKRVGGDWISSTSVSVPTATWTTLELTVLADVDDAYFMIVSGDTSILPVWVDDAKIGEGLPAASLGQMWLDLLADAQTDHAPGRQALVHVVPTFTGAVDSNGVAWTDPALAVRIKRGSTYGRFLGVASKWGYEHRLEWNETNSRFEFDVYNPTGLGVAVTGPAIVGARGGISRSSPLVVREPDANYAFVEGDEGEWAESSDATIEAIWGRSETYDGSKELAGTTLSVQSANRLTEASNRSEGLKLTLEQPSARPWIDFQKGDTIDVTLGSSAAPKVNRRVASIIVKSGEPAPIWQVDFNSRVFTGGSAVAEGVRRLLTKFEGLEDTAPAAAETTTGGGEGTPYAFPTILIAAYNAPDRIKAVADLVCDFTNDDEEIAIAFDLLGGYAGRVFLSAGNFSVRAGQLILPQRTSIIGAGKEQTWIQVEFGSDGIIFDSGSYGDALFRDFSFQALVC